MCQQSRKVCLDRFDLTPLGSLGYRGAVEWLATGGRRWKVLGDGMKAGHEAAHDGAAYGIHGYGVAEETGHGGYGTINDAAGDDVIVVVEVGVDIEGEAVMGNVACYFDADGGDLGTVDPDTGEAVLDVGPNVEVGEGVDEEKLQLSDVLAGAKAELAEVDDRVAYKLAWAVVGNLSTSVRLDKGGSDGVKAGGVEEDVLRRGAATHGVDMGVLKEDEGIRDLAGGTLGNKPSLEGPGLVVVYTPAQPADTAGDAGAGLWSGRCHGMLFYPPGDKLFAPPL